MSAPSRARSPPPHLPTCLVQTPSPPAPPLLREHLTALGFAAAVTAILFSPAWGRVLFSRDLLRYFYPGVFFYRQSLLAGWIPLWNPSLYLGYPFLAELSNGMVLYPLRLLHLFFSAALGIKVFAAVHYLLAGYLMWRLLREWGLTQLPALFGGLCWMGSGYLVSQYLNLSYLAPGVWSRRLTQEHRLVYLVRKVRIDFLQARYHY